MLHGRTRYLIVRLYFLYIWLTTNLIMANDRNYFLYSRQYPKTLSILEGQQINMPKFCEDALFVFDTNSLLVPYNVGSESLNEIKRILETVLTPDRIFVSAHTLREFAKHRSSKISELFTEIDKALSSLPSIKEFNYPILGELESYKDLKDCKVQIASSVKHYKETLQSLQNGINEWNWFDPVTKLYNSIFKEDNIIDASTDEAALTTEFNERMEDDIPPGNKDKSKPENAIGDFLIWKSILELGKKKKTNVVFVTNDEKNDWMLKGNKKSISTRFELVDEFFRYTENRFTCLNFADFLKIQGATKEVILEVETIVEANDNKKNVDALSSLNKIYVIIKRFINNGSEPGEDSYIEDDAINKFITEFSNNWEEEILGNPSLLKIKDAFYGIDDILLKIKSLNGEVHYQAIRMKRSTYDQQIELRRLCVNFLKIMNDIELIK